MANLTITVDPEVLKRARIKALENDESISAVLARKLAEYVEEADRDQLDKQHEAMLRLVELSERTHSGSGPGGRTWTREELYDR